MKYFTQTLLSVFSCVLVMLVYYLLCIFVIQEIRQNVWHIVLYVCILAIILLLHFILGYRFAARFSKGGFVVQFVILLLLSVAVACLDNTFVFNVGIFLVPIYIYGKGILWYWNAPFSDSAVVKSVLVVLSAVLPSLLLFLGCKIRRKKQSG